MASDDTTTATRAPLSTGIRDGHHTCPVGYCSAKLEKVRPREPVPTTAIVTGRAIAMRSSSFITIRTSRRPTVHHDALLLATMPAYALPRPCLQPVKNILTASTTIATSPACGGEINPRPSSRHGSRTCQAIRPGWNDRSRTDSFKRSRPGCGARSSTLGSLWHATRPPRQPVTSIYTSHRPVRTPDRAGPSNWSRRAGHR
jgi:hypothetical protein